MKNQCKINKKLPEQKILDNFLANLLNIPNSDHNGSKEDKKSGLMDKSDANFSINLVVYAL